MKNAENQSRVHGVVGRRKRTGLGLPEREIVFATADNTKLRATRPVGRRRRSALLGRVFTSSDAEQHPAQACPSKPGGWMPARLARSGKIRERLLAATT